MDTGRNSPTRAREYFDRANAFRETREFERAISDFQLILRGPEDDADYFEFYAGFAQPVHLFLGNAFAEMGDYDEAIASYNKDIRLGGAANPHAYHARGNAYVQ